MEKVVHRAENRGKGDYGWLTTRYSFSFADWYEPARMGFGALRVINDDTIAPSSGFGMHSHKDMEIITVVTHGAVTHKDSLGNTGVVPAGEVQVMSAGTGVTHSEYNDSRDTPLSLFQIWIVPDAKSIAPRYDQKSFGQKEGATLLVSPDGREGSLSIRQEAFITRVRAGTPFTYAVTTAGNGVYLFLIDGSVVVDGVSLGARDALGVTDAAAVTIEPKGAATFLIIEVPVQA
jgi:redox-sensitive bicupin YhaK (pirin superfamily)